MEDCLKGTGRMISEKGKDLRGMLTVTPMKVGIIRGNHMGMEYILGEITAKNTKENGIWVQSKEKESG